MSSPTGTLEPTKSGDLADQAAAQQEDSASYGNVFGSISGGGAMSAPLATETTKGLVFQSLKPQASSFGGGITCDAASGSSSNASVNCTCSGGGSAKIEGKVDGNPQGGGAYSADVSMSFNACKTDSAVINGNFHFYTSFPDGAAKPETGIIVYTGSFTVQQGSDAPKQVEFGYGMMQNKMYFLVKTPEGSFAVNADPWDRTTKTGTVTIKDKSGFHTCTVTNGTATCTDGTGA